MSGNFLTVEQLYFSRHNTQILKGIYFSESKNKVVSIVGLNGSGKSTFLNYLAGFTNSNSSHIFINGTLVSRAKRKSHMFYLNQDGFIINDLKIKAILNMFSIDSRMIIPKYLGNELLSKKFIQLSGGEKRILQLLLALNTDKAIILLDEPFVELDPIYINQFEKMIREKAQQGKLIICVDHKIDSVKKISDTIYIMDNGTLNKA